MRPDRQPTSKSVSQKIAGSLKDLDKLKNHIGIFDKLDGIANKFLAEVKYLGEKMETREQRNKNLAAAEKAEKKKAAAAEKAVKEAEKKKAAEKAEKEKAAENKEAVEELTEGQEKAAEFVKEASGE